jgi:PEP-CTERM motif-containing protein
MKFRFVAVLSLLLNTAVIHAANFNVQTVQYPTDPTFTQLLGINNSGKIAGFHGATTASGFTLTLPGAFTTENYPAAMQTMVTGINSAGSTVGIYVDAGGTTHGFTDIGGTFKTVDQGGTVFNQGLGINASNTTVGYSSAIDPAGMIGQTAYSQSGGVFTNINALLPSNQNSQAVGINNAGDVVGFYMPTSTTSLGFEDIGGSIKTIDPFGSSFTQALGINNEGEIVGFYTDAGGVQHGYTDVNGLFESFDPTGSTSTTINGLNDIGQIVGFYTDANDNTIGFVGTAVPEPAPLGLLGFGTLIGVALSRRRRAA